MLPFHLFSSRGKNYNSGSNLREVYERHSCCLQTRAPERNARARVRGSARCVTGMDGTAKEARGDSTPRDAPFRCSWREVLGTGAKEYLGEWYEGEGGGDGNWKGKIKGRGKQG